ncbi:MAG: hypothetical protein HUU38_27235 [Anaerolineales bacterium]|nr:hypothetical protein [Anaerolineales bacterium]
MARVIHVRGIEGLLFWECSGFQRGLFFRDRPAINGRATKQRRMNPAE